jgi:hypothetical protein
MDIYNKYYPKLDDDFNKNNININIILNWIKSFKKEKYASFLIYGPHGSGKSYIINTILKNNNIGIKLIDFQKIKTYKNIESYLNGLANSVDIIDLMNGLIVNTNVILIDESSIDDIFQEKLLLLKILKVNHDNHICPIIFVFGTTHNKILNEIKKKSKNCYIDAPTNDELKNLLYKICVNEKITVKPPNIIDEIIDNAQNDYRKLINNFLDLIMNYAIHNKKNILVNKVVFDEYKKLMIKKDIEYEIFYTGNTLFHEYKGIENSLKLYNFEKILVPLLIHQHYIDIYNNIMENNANKNYDKKKLFKSIKNINKSLSIADLIDSYINNEQKWGLLNLNGFFSCCIPSYEVNTLKYKYNFKLKFPIDMNKTSIKKSNTKHILQSYKTFNLIDPDNYLYLIKIIKYNIVNNKNLLNMIKTYKLNINDIENVLRINKIDSKYLITSKEKQLINKLIQNL